MCQLLHLTRFLRAGGDNSAVPQVQILWEGQLEEQVPYLGLTKSARCGSCLGLCEEQVPKKGTQHWNVSGGCLTNTLFFPILSFGETTIFLRRKYNFQGPGCMVHSQARSRERKRKLQAFSLECSKEKQEHGSCSFLCRGSL